MRRRKLLVALAGLAVVVAAGTLMLWPRADRINYANFNRVEQEMSRDDVEALLGLPNFSESELGKMGFADFSKRIDLDWQTGPFIPGGGWTTKEEFWISNEVVISVTFRNGRAVRKIYLQRGGPIRRLLNDWAQSH
jgi:hypothetical protein